MAARTPGIPKIDRATASADRIENDERKVTRGDGMEDQGKTAG